MSNIIEATLPQLKRIIYRQCGLAPSKRTPIIMMGPPGCGKSAMPLSIFGQWHTELNCSQDEKESIAGQKYAQPDRDYVSLLLEPAAKEIFERAPQVPQVNGKPGAYLLIIEEIGQADSGMQKALGAVLNSRRIAGRKLPPNVVVIANGNGTQHSSGSGKLLPHLINRSGIYHVKRDADSWFQWAVKHKINEKILAFLNAKRDALYLTTDSEGTDPDDMLRAMLKKASAQGTNIPSLRSWTNYSYVLDAMEKEPDPISDEEHIIQAAAYVGQERAHEFVSLMNVKVPYRMDLLNGVVDWPSHPYEEWNCILREAKLTNIDTSERAAKILSKIDPEMVVIYLQVLKQRLTAEGGANALNPMRVLKTWPGMDYLISSESRYGAAMGAV